jgi:hypothetical protein
MNSLLRLLTLPVLALTVATAHAGTFANITVDGDTGDWSSIPVASLSFNNAPGGGLDITEVKLANNGTTLFALVTFATAVNPNNVDLAGTGATLYFGIDKDQSVGTGFNVFGVDRVGIEAAWRNDEGLDALNGGNLSSGAAISPFGVVTTTQEISVSLTSLLSNSTPVFGGAGSTFNFVFYTSGNGFFSTEGNPVFDEMVVGSYTLALAAVPEPATFAGLAGMGALTLAFLRRRR